MTVLDHTALRGREIVCLATQEWDANWTPVQQVMLRLAPQNKVLYIEPFRALAATFRRGSTVHQEQLRQGVPHLREVRPNLFVCRLAYPYLPWNMKSGATHAINSWLLPRELSRLFRRLDVRRPWLWAFFTQSLSVLDLPFERIIYDCVDDWPSYFTHPGEREFVTRIDDNLTRRADLAFVVSEALLAKKKHQNESMFVVHNGVDYAHFAAAASKETRIPADIERIPHPRIGFVGMIDELRFDGELIRAVAENPAHQVVIVAGFVGQGRTLVPSLPNVHVLGMKPVEQLPAYLKGMDVCMMPYQVNETTHCIFPLKLFEYLATGKPVVSTAIPAVEGLDGYLRIGRTRDEYIRHIAAALEEDEGKGSELRMSLARQQTWEAHVAKKVSLILRNPTD